MLNTNEYASYYKSYVDLAGEEPLIASLERSKRDFVAFFENIVDDKLLYAYQDNKWTIKEIMLHLVDAERVFQYRALRFSRKDKTDLPGFDENFYVPNSSANNRSRASLIEEFKAVRQSTIALFNSLSDEALLELGSANKSLMSVRAIGYVVVGHQQHHINVIQDRYLS